MGNKMASIDLKNFDGQLLPSGFEKLKERCANFEVRDSDVWLICFPKTGSTWMHEMLWLITHDYDYEGSKVATEYRTPYFERGMADVNSDIMKLVTQSKDAGRFVMDSLEYMETMESPRVVKTHLNWNNIPKQLKDGCKRPRIVYLTRNPKDTFVSFIHFFRVLFGTEIVKLIFGFKETVEESAELFFNDKAALGPFFDHILPFWARRNEPNVLFLTYEEMKADLRGVVLKVTAFLGKTINDEQMTQLLDHLSIDKMRENKAINQDDFVSTMREILQHDYEGNFINKGVVGNFKEVMSPELIERFDKWTDDKLKGTGFRFQA